MHSNLRKRTIRLAAANPRLRPVLLPLLASGRVAKAFPNSDALKKYLKDHPGANPKNHSVSKSDGHGSAPEAPKKSWKEHLVGLKDSVTKAIADAPKEVQKFIQDPEHRQKVFSSMGAALKASPGKIAKSALHSVKHLKEEYTHAGKGLLTIAKGNKPSKEERKALISVGIGIGVAALSAATAGTGAAVVFGGTLGKNTLAHMALSAVHAIGGDAFTAYEGFHLVEGLVHLVASDHSNRTAEEKAEAAMQAYSEIVVKAVQKQLEKGMTDEDMVKALNEGK